MVFGVFSIVIECLVVRLECGLICFFVFFGNVILILVGISVVWLGFRFRFMLDCKFMLDDCGVLYVGRVRFFVFFVWYKDI